MNFYIKEGNLTIDIENRRIADLQRGKPDENAIELDALVSVQKQFESIESFVIQEVA